jgi:mono/diheme cytochrome c family protein
MPSTPFAALTAAAFAAVLVAGCAKGNDSASSTSSPDVAATVTAQVVALTANPAHGKQIFSANCAECHGPTGLEGGIGPKLKNEKSRKNYAQTVAWIKNPQPPMPKLYPDPLSEQDVADVAAYVHSL